ncbi:MAG: hypothetical protein JWN78_1490 [Bacteroidota bacterium]|nr:hypothetical protein [Bacteroidota bacterium]
MTKHKKTTKQTQVSRQGAVGHQLERTEEIDDSSLLPEAEEIERLSNIDPDIMNWLKARAEKEQDFRHTYNTERVRVFDSTRKGEFWLNFFGLSFAYTFLLLIAGLSFLLICKGEIITGSIFSGGFVIAIIGILITRNTNKPKDQ